MPNLERKDILFDSADGKNKIAAYFYSSKEVAPVAILQISHGMCEYFRRYEDFANFLVHQGVFVCGNDHLGHGASAPTPEDEGFFTEKGGRQFVLQDLKTMNELAHAEYPGLPIFLLGHSMGSFFARNYASLWPESIAGLVISGTGYKNPLAGVGIPLAKLIMRVKGERYRSKLLHNTAFGSYLKNIPDAKTPHDWISRDGEIVETYAKDPKCTFVFTANGFHELMNILESANSDNCFDKTPKNLPILMIQGEADPVGDYSNGTYKVYQRLLENGVKDINYIVYPGARHEVLNETNRQEVYADVLKFVIKHK